MRVPFLKPNINEADIELMNQSIRTGWLRHGPYTEKFETNLAKYLGAKFAVMTGSATAALHLGLILAGVKEGDEVITTPLSWVATSNVAIYQKAKPVFVDVEESTGLIDTTKIEEKISSKTKAILLVHLYGAMVDMKKIKDIADKHNIKIIEDTAHALEASREGIRPGELGFCAALSFHGAKNLTSGQGGAYITNSQSDAEKIKLLRRDGVKNVGEKRVMFELGYKYDSTDFQAALLIGQLKRVKESHTKRQQIFARYREAFRGNKSISFQEIKFPHIHACHLFVIWVPRNRRDKIRRKISEGGVETSIHYPPIHLEPYYREKFGFRDGDFPVAEKLGASVIALPTYPSLSKKEQDYVIEQVLKSI